MNKRIKELLDQCTDQTMTKPWPLIDAEKFAELIVRECASTLTKLGGAYDGSETDADYMQGMLDSAVIIKEHFGVEE